MNQRQLFLQHLAQTSPFPLALEIEYAEGLYLYDTAGKTYMDLIAGIGVSVLGHRHPKVAAGIKNQLDRYWHTMVYGEYILAPQVQLATRLASHLPDTLNSVYLVNSGTEATEGAMKLAKRYTGRAEIVACRYAYHGSTQGSASLMWPKDFTAPYHPLLPGISHIDFNEPKQLSQITEKTACVILETVQAEWGVRKPSDDYLRKVRDRCTETGALMVLDEIQAGYGRTGSLFAFEQYSVTPDILLLGKGMGGGMPIAAFIADKAVMGALSDNPILGHITTFGGNPVCCAAALATLETLIKEKWIEQVAGKAALFVELLRHPAIAEVRHAGLMIAVELSDFDAVQTVIRHCLEKGLIIDWFLFNNRSLRLAPPLIISEIQIREACAILLEALDRL
mgnify:CR=1 FL=1